MWFRKKAMKSPAYLTCTGCGCLMRRARKEVGVWVRMGPAGSLQGTSQSPRRVSV